MIIGNGVCHCAGEHCYDEDHGVQLYKLLYGHGMISTDTFQAIYQGCGYQDIYSGGGGSTASEECKAAQAQANLEHGKF